MDGVTPSSSAPGSRSNVFRLAAPGRLRSLLLDGSDPVLLLGAGASITSGIPAAGTTVGQVARWAWCKENGRHPDDSTVRRSDYWPWVAAQPWFRQDVSPAELYPDAIDNLLGVKSDRREFFERLINPPGVPPSRGYTALTQILHQGWISTVATTNFDQCLERAQVLNNRPHRLVSISTPADHVMFSSTPQHPQLIFLHGSVKHYTDKNLSSEVEALDPSLVNRLRPLLQDHPVIVVGYRGAEASVMRDLFLAQATAGGFLHGVYWCVLEGEQAGPLSPWVTQLADAIGTNFQLVPIKGFDDLLEKELLATMTAAEAQPTRRPSAATLSQLPTRAYQEACRRVEVIQAIACRRSARTTYRHGRPASARSCAGGGSLARPQFGRGGPRGAVSGVARRVACGSRRGTTSPYRPACARRRCRRAGEKYFGDGWRTPRPGSFCCSWEARAPASYGAWCRAHPPYSH